MGFVFPTCVGVFLIATGIARGDVRLPHVRGGVSFFIVRLIVHPPSSPRAWGCFQAAIGFYLFPLVFPTCVGVFLEPCSARPGASCLPHVRGGVSL